MSTATFIAALVFRGIDLCPEAVTEHVGVNPTQSHRAGHRFVTSTGKEVTERTGFWCLRVEAETSNAFEQLLSRLPSRQLSAIAGVEDAYLDLYIVKDYDRDTDSDLEFAFDRVACRRIAELDLPVSITFGVAES